MRIPTLAHIATMNDPTYTNVNLFIWTCAEMSTVHICAAAPAIRSLASRVKKEVTTVANGYRKSYKDGGRRTDDFKIHSSAVPGRVNPEIYSISTIECDAEVVDKELSGDIEMAEHFASVRDRTTKIASTAMQATRPPQATFQMLSGRAGRGRVVQNSRQFSQPAPQHDSQSTAPATHIAGLFQNDTEERGRTDGTSQSDSSRGRDDSSDCGTLVRERSFLKG